MIRALGRTTDRLAVWQTQLMAEALGDAAGGRRLDRARSAPAAPRRTPAAPCRTPRRRGRRR